MQASHEDAQRPVQVESGNLRIRLAETDAEIQASQRLRYAVFVTERNATPTPEQRETGREFDAYDAHADHLLVFDTAIADGPEGVIGTYRLMRREQAERAGQFYTSDEYDIDALLAYPGEIMELGRSCVAADHRTGATMQLLWRGIAAYVLHFDVHLMFGCASMLGTDPDALGEQLAYLYHHHLAPPALRPVARPDLYVDMNRLDPDAFKPRRAAAKLPPLLKGYLRLGGFVGDGAVVDQDFNTTDVCVVVKTDLVTDRYVRHLTRDDKSEG
ncbi:ornithine-acyl[acyl carrier protein] N-acyltransferase [Limimonas halophila]|uniref:L-ornithine N(alpha)-acyltransferase n=1 Tax=Limimonas halophila TaxID=1082479 RepID=A0A1G7SKK4_9PROT|nr:GNAT family N-acyltransferase [Limimonas halophila]SDG23543.1 ornithine-acyl[acyl carrier protein] N-acyltransferase [Limimonas halophila]